MKYQLTPIHCAEVEECINRTSQQDQNSSFQNKQKAAISYILSIFFLSFYLYISLYWTKSPLKHVLNHFNQKRANS